jgi:hypothetical protein
MLALFVLLQAHPVRSQTPAQTGNHFTSTKVHKKPEPPPPVIVKVDNQVSCEECGKKDPMAQKDPDKWIRRGFYVNAGLMLITLIIAGATLLQANAAKTQAHVMKKQSDDANQSATEAAILAQNTLNAIERQVINLRRQALWMKASARANRLSASAAVTLAKAATTSADAAQDAVRSSDKARALAEDTAKRQLRAYICVNTAALELFSPNQPTPIVNFKNCGQTPAYDVRCWIHTWIAHYPLTETLPIPPEDFMMASNTLGPGGTTHMVAPKKAPLDQFTTNMLGTATATYFVYGRVTYKDVFGRQWYTNYRLMYGGPREQIDNRKADGKDQVWVLSPDVEGNEAT